MNNSDDKDISILRIQWTGPHSVEQVLKKDGEDDCGLYQVYGKHTVFGANSLLYIGQTTEQTFAVRFAAHQKDWLRDEEGVSIHLGTLDAEDYPDDPPDWTWWRELVLLAEALTIFWHTPPYNSQHLTYREREAVRVCNLGERGRLLETYTNEWKPRPEEAGE